MNRTEFLKDRKIKRVVIKVGTSLISDGNSPDGVNHAMIAKLRDEVLWLKERGIAAMLVSSGAVGTGRHVLKQYGLHTQTAPGVRRRQALSAIGQGQIVSRYAEAFAEAKIPVAQLLITARDFRHRRAYLNMGGTIQELHRMGALAVVNENDTTSTDELQFGDNDLLSAIVAALYKADLLMILTSVPGFLMNGERVPELTHIGDAERAAAGGPEGPGRGGMSTKIRAGELCGRSGAALAILPGAAEYPVRDFLNGADIGTFIFTGEAQKLNARKQWLLFARAEGGVTIDAGAVRALRERGSSLLAVGVRAVRGQFLAGEVIEIEDAAGAVIGRGIAGFRSREIAAMLSESKDAERDGAVIVHRSDLILE